MAVIVGGQDIRPEGGCSGPGVRVPGSAERRPSCGVEVPMSWPGRQGVWPKGGGHHGGYLFQAVLIGGRYVLTVRDQVPGS